MKKYRVYVGGIQNLPLEIKYSFCDPAMSRMLVFDSNKPQGDFCLLKKSDEDSLSAREIAWLSNSRISVAMGNASKSAQEAAADMNRLMDILEQELKREKEAMSNGEQTE